MHRNYNQLKEGCLSVKVTQIRDPVVTRIENVGEHIRYKIADVTEHIHCNISNITEHLQVCCSIVCSVNTTGKYLNVAPTVVWLTPDMLSGEFNIYSNTEWVIN